MRDADQSDPARAPNHWCDHHATGSQLLRCRSRPPLRCDWGSTSHAVSVLAGESPTSITVAGGRVIDATAGAVRVWTATP